MQSCYPYSQHLALQFANRFHLIPQSYPNSMARKITKARRWFYVLFLPACFLVFAYPAHRLTDWHGYDLALSAPQTALLWLFSTFAMWYSFSSPKKFMRYIMVHWMGISFILCVLTLLYEVVRLIVPLPDHTAVHWIVSIGTGVVVSAILLSHVVGVKHLKFHSAKVTARCRIVQISDVHIGSRQGRYLARIVRRINQLEPHAVVITGDLLDSAAVGYDDLKSLKQLRARTLFSTGNHERYADLDTALGLLARLGVEVLRQQQVMVGEIQILGIDDADERTQVGEQLPLIAKRNDRYTILLYHRPLGWEAALAHGIDLMLCGHTHNGQVFPFNLLVKQQFKRIHGLYSQGAKHLYVSPGTGTWGPLMRLGSLNEITCIDIHPSEQS